MKTKAKKLVYWLVSGEGELGYWERVFTTPLGIKQRLARERRRGERWAHAYFDFFVEDYYGSKVVYGRNVESNEPHVLPDYALSDVA